MHASRVGTVAQREETTSPLQMHEAIGGCLDGSTVSQPASEAYAGDWPRRILNVLVAAIGLAICAPLMFLIAVLTMLTSPGPVLYVQPRVGLDRRERRLNMERCRRLTDQGGKPFRIYKFRTMVTDGSRKPNQTWATPDDPRVTPIGRLLRQYRLDELPQLINVLRGDMNIVGPRPEQPEIFAALRPRIERYAERQTVHPGITGWAQINQRYDRSIDDVRRKLDFDLEYIQRRSLFEDLRIMLRTIPVVIFRRGAW